MGESHSLPELESLVMSSCQSVLLLSVLLVLVSQSQSAFINGLDARNFDDLQLDSEPSLVSLEDDERHKRNLGVRHLDDYRPYWFARDLRGSRGSKGAKVYRPVRATFSAWGGK